ncbi:MAG: hypothetical protein AAF551_10515 [Bacteroidota bacterium]
MTHRLTLFAAFFFSIGLICAQDLVGYNQERLDLTKTGMLILGSWAATNMMTSPIFATRTSGSTKFFHQMNGYWNVVNLVIAGLGYYGATKDDPFSFSLSQSLIEQQKLEKLLLFNGGLDIAYVMGGLYLVERSKRVEKNRDRLNGFGKSIMLQGAFLFAFDIVFYWVQHQHGTELLKIVDGLALAPSGFRYSFTF